MKIKSLKWERTSKVEVFRESSFSIVEIDCWQPNKLIRHRFFSMDLSLETILAHFVIKRITRDA